MRITVHNRGPDTAPICILPQAWFRNEWSWSDDFARPEMHEATPGEVHGDHALLGRFTLSFEAQDRLIFCDNDTNFAKVFGVAGPAGYCKDGFDDFIVHGRRTRSIRRDAAPRSPVCIIAPCRPAGPRSCACACVSVPTQRPAFAGFDALVDQRRQEADAFYAVLQAGIANADMRGWCSARPSRACCGANSSTITMSANGWMAILASRRPRSDAKPAATVPGGI